MIDDKLFNNTTYLIKKNLQLNLQKCWC